MVTSETRNREKTLKTKKNPEVIRPKNKDGDLPAHNPIKKRAQELRPTRFFGMAMYPTPGVGRSSCARFLVRLCTAPLGWAAAPKGGPQPVKMAFLRPTILFSAAGTTDYKFPNEVETENHFLRIEMESTMESILYL